MSSRSQMTLGSWMFWLILVKNSSSLSGNAAPSLVINSPNSSPSRNTAIQPNLKNSLSTPRSAQRVPYSLITLPSASHRSLMKVCKLNRLASTYLFFDSRLPLMSCWYFQLISSSFWGNLKGDRLGAGWAYGGIGTIEEFVSWERVRKRVRDGPLWSTFEMLGFVLLKMSRIVQRYSLFISCLRLKFVITHRVTDYLQVLAMQTVNMSTTSEGMPLTQARSTPSRQLPTPTRIPMPTSTTISSTVPP